MDKPYPFIDLSTSPSTVRECLAQGLGPYRSLLRRGDMTVAHARHLIETYPALYQHADSPAVGSSPAFARDGFACGDGWFGIIDRLSKKLVEDPYLVVIQVKEKMGELRVYLDGADGAPDPAPVLTERLEAERIAAREESRHTCELCGAPGKLVETRRHWLFTRCKSCSWLDDLVQACGHLGKLVEGKDFNTFAASESDMAEEEDDDEDAEDIHLADESRAEIRAGGALFTHEQVLERYGLGPPLKVGIISDIHGDIVSLDLALGQLRRAGCTTILCPGDLLDVEPFGEEVVQRIKAEGVVCIRGNHERWALERRRRRTDPRRSAPSIVEPADLFTGGAELSREALAWLATLPSHWSAELAGVRVAMWHARPSSDMEGIRADATGPALRRRLLDDARADVLVVGHTHDSFELRAGKGRILNAGACCSKTYSFRQSGALIEPAGYRPATFGLLELPSKRFTVLCALGS